jgi:hypothetical protein
MKTNDVKIRSEHDSITMEVFLKRKITYYKRLLETGVFVSSKYKKYNNIANENISQYIEELKTMIKEWKSAENEV